MYKNKKSLFLFFCGFAIGVLYLNFEKIGNLISEEPNAIEIDNKKIITNQFSKNKEPIQSKFIRDKDEWQGMAYDSEIRVSCYDHFCGMAKSCINNNCQPCSLDEECEKQELCVLGHCLLEDMVSCRTRKDCKSEEYCILSGYSNTPRGNEDMRSSCLSTKLVISQPGPEEQIIVDYGQPIKRTMDVQDLFDQLHKNEDAQ